MQTKSEPASEGEAGIHGSYDKKYWNQLSLLLSQSYSLFDLA